MTALRWQDSAACQGQDPAVFDALPFGDVARAQIICEPCPVRRQCHALGKALEADGVWGGAYLKSGITVLNITARGLTDEQLRVQHSLWQHGTRNDATRAGEAEYSRRRRVIQRLKIELSA